jgi:prepilin-type N-terminal cleavage/methylation domain-containing protein
MSHRAGERSQHGFTLIEMMVVLVIIAGLLTIAYASFTPLYARVRVAFERDDFERQLLDLPLRVRQSGHGGILVSRSADRLIDGTILSVDGVPLSGDGGEEWQVLRLNLPGAWRLRVAAPIFYHFSGTCEGGEVEFLLSSVSLRYRLTPPLCRPIRSDADTRG